ncbi:MAG: MATE family efflux transporter [Faecalibacterium sp.]
MSQTKTLVQGNVISSLVAFAFPILLSILLQTTYGTADLLIVGQFSSVNDLSGVTIGSQLMQSVTNFFTGLSMGTTVLLGRYIGAGQKEKASRTVGVSIAAFSAAGLLGAAFLVICNHGIINIMQTPVESWAQTCSYLYITGAGAVFIVLYNLIGSIFRGLGDSKTPLIAVFIACVINIALDLVFVAGFGLGASGAAIATVVAQGASVLISVLRLRKQALPFTLSKQDICFDFGYIKEIFILGIPIAVQSALVSASFLVITAIFNGIGVIASAAVGVVSKISALIMVIPQAFAQALAAFVAQNLGAGKPERGKKALFYSISLSVAFGVVFAYISWAHGIIFTRIFTSDAELTIAALSYLKSYAVDCIFVAFMFSFTGYFSGLGKTTFVMLQGISGAFLIRIPLAYFFSTLENTSLFLIGLATPSSTLVQIVACVWYYIYLAKQEQRNIRLGSER